MAQAGKAEVDAAVAAAKAAYKQWRLVPAPRRGEVLYKVAELLQERKEELARLMTQEMGKVLSEARGDVQEAIDMAYFMGGEGRRMHGYTAPVEMPEKFGMALRDSVGVIGLVTPWNFPVAVPSWNILPALVAGDTIVWKPSEETPATSAAFVQVFIDAGVPEGVFSLVLGAGDVGAALVEHPDVRVISFTGSTETGLKVYQQSRQPRQEGLPGDGRQERDHRTRRRQPRLGDQGGDVERLRHDRAALHRHQPLDRPERHQAQADRSAGRTGEGAQDRLRHGRSVEVGPLVNQKALDKVERYVGIGKGEGARVAVGGGRADLDKGYFYQPTLFADVKPDMRIAREEIFGPVLSAIEVGSLEQAIEVNNSVIYGLSSSIFTENVNAAFRAIRDLTTGIVYINHGTTGAEIQFPFGGTRGTGNGMREAGQTALDSFTEWKSVYVDYSGRLQRAQIDNRE